MNKIVLVLGMHRSGTSALTRVISLLGAGLPKSILGKNESNLRGHWESEIMIAQHDALLAELGSDWQDWRRLNTDTLTAGKRAALEQTFTSTVLSDYDAADDVWVVKEPRICRFSGPYIEALEAQAPQVFSLIMVRNPLEVASSLHARDDMEMLDALFLWLTSMLEVELATRGKPRHFISYESFLSAPALRCSEAVKASGFEFRYSVSDVKKQIEAYVSPSLKRQSFAAEDVRLDSLARGFVSDAFEAFLVLCENPKSAGALKKLDAVRDAYFPLLGPLYDVLSHERSRLSHEHREAIVARESVFETSIANLEAKQKAAWDERELSHKTAWDERGLSHKAAWDKREAEYKETLKEIVDSHSQALSARDAEQENAVKGLLDDRDRAHEQAVASLKQHHADTLESINSQNAEQYKSLRLEIENLTAEHSEHVSDLKASHEDDIQRLNSEISFMRDEFGALLGAAESRASQRAAEVDSVRRELAAVLGSTSWKVTGGLRRVLNALKGVKSSPHLPQGDQPPRLEFNPDKSD